MLSDLMWHLILWYYLQFWTLFWNLLLHLGIFLRSHLKWSTRREATQRSAVIVVLRGVSRYGSSTACPPFPLFWAVPQGTLGRKGIEFGLPYIVLVSGMRRYRACAWAEWTLLTENLRSRTREAHAHLKWSSQREVSQTISFSTPSEQPLLPVAEVKPSCLHLSALAADFPFAFPCEDNDLENVRNMVLMEQSLICIFSSPQIRGPAAN